MHYPKYITSVVNESYIFHNIVTEESQNYQTIFDIELCHFGW